MPVLEETPVVAYYPVEKDYLVPSEGSELTYRAFSTSTLIHDTFGSITPVMERIAWCESRNRQFVDGKVLTSTTLDYGYFQISHIWEDRAKELGLDFKNSLTDNIRMAKVVFDLQGLDAWVCSRL